MSPRALIRHHTGRMAGPARWYLAALAMASLMLLAAHFSVQEHVQKNLRVAVHDWLKQSGGDVQYVRYRLLRGALTLQHVSWIDPADSELRLDVAQVFVRTSSRAMFASDPSFSLLRLEQPVLTLRRATLLGWLSGDKKSSLSSLAELLQHAQSVAVEDMNLLLTTEQGGLADDFLLQQMAGSVSKDGISMRGTLDTGTISLNASTDDAGLLDGRLGLRGISPAAFAGLTGGGSSHYGSSHYGSSHSQAAANGELALSGDWKKRTVGVVGKLQLLGEAGPGVLGVQGGWSAAGVDVGLNCENVPLTALPLDWPAFAGRSLAGGRLTGVMHVERKPDVAGEAAGGEPRAGWRIGMEGRLSGVHLVAESLPAWRIGSVRLKRAVLSSDSFAAAGVELADADISINTFTAPYTSGPVKTPRIESLGLERIRTQLLFADGSALALPEMQGSGRMDSGLPASARPGHLSISSIPDDAELAAGGSGETWKIETEGDVFSVWQAQVKAARVPLVRLRALLPRASLPGEQGVPEYSGHADLMLQLRSSEPGVQLDGHVTLLEMRMMQGGDQFAASRIDVDIAEAGSDGRRSLSRVEFADWHYQMALSPLARINRLLQEMPAAGGMSVAQPEAGSQLSGVKQKNIVDVSESTAPMQAFNWEVEEVVAQDGRISLGQPDALIAEKLLFRMHHLVSGLLSPFTLSGTFSDGELQVRGKLALQPGLRIDAKADISNALPFVFNDWMRLSGMPRFVRGRMDAGFSIAEDGPALTGAYTGKLNISMYLGSLEAGAFPDDPMLQRTGYSSQGLLERLNAARRFSFTIPFQGAWQTSNLAGNIGEAGLAALKKAAGKASMPAAKTESPVARLTRLRLQGKRGFSYNERVRLRQMAKVMLADASLIVELTPQLGKAQPDADMTARVLLTQRQVGLFLSKFGISDKRIFPVWPQPRHRHGDAPGLLLQAHAP